MNDVVVKLENVSKFYKLYGSPRDRLKEALNPSGKSYHKKFYALKDINIEIKKGEVLGIVGKNGCGKSTLLKLMSSILTPNTGKVAVKGKVSALLELGAGFNPEFTGLQNIYFYATIVGLTEEAIDQEIENIIAFSELGDFIYQPLKTYSSGMKSRLGFSVAIHINPEILILDEVLAVGDDMFRRKCYAKMEDLFKNGKTVIYVSHDANSIKNMCSRAIFLDKGELLLDGDPNDVTKCYHKFYLLDMSERAQLRKRLLRAVDSEVKGELYDAGTDGEHRQEHKRNNVVNDDYVEFSELFINDESGETLNNLNLNCKYNFNFVVRFKQEFRNVSLGVQIRTTKGIIVSGASLKSNDGASIGHVRKGERYSCLMRFNSYLLPGTYFFTVFMDDGEGNSSVFYDALLFKVFDKDAKQGGLVTLNQKFFVNKI